MTAHRVAWVCYWQSTGQAKSYSVDVGTRTLGNERARDRKWIALGLRVLHTHALRHGEPPPSCQAERLARCQKSEEVKHFCTERPQRAKQGIGKEWQNPREKLRTFRFWPPFDALFLAAVFTLVTASSLVPASVLVAVRDLCLPEHGQKLATHAWGA